MIFKNLYINIIIRVILIAATPILFVLAFQKYHDIIISLNIAALFIIQIVLLIRRLNYINRDLIAFFDSLKYDDSSVLLTNEFQNINYMRLSRRLKIVNKQILQLKEKNAKQYQYFKTITETANVGLISFNKNGTVKLANKTLKDLLNLPSLVNIKDLNKVHPDFSDILNNLQPDNQKLIKISLNENKGNKEILQLLLKSAAFNTDEEKLKIISIQNIKNELDEKELESWQKLTRILRHEIMNSISPISSTIDTLNDLIINPDKNLPYNANELTNDLVKDISEGLNIIKERNVGLQKFVENFRSISKLPHPVFERINIQKLFYDINTFWETEFEKLGIKFEIKIDDPKNTFIGDKSQIEQLIINLIKNSIEAGSQNILISSTEDFHESTEIKIIDDGHGIPKEIIEEIFLPFYTTKEQGSGIGLSLARQIMRLHGGNISVKSTPKLETVFTLKF